MSDLFVPPAAEGLPLAALDSATEGADRLDAFARTPTGRNFLAHALVQLARDGWLRTEPGDGFEPARDWEATPEPEESERCGQCRLPFDAEKPGRGQYTDTPYCLGCIDRCHDSTDAFHRCVICE